MSQVTVSADPSPLTFDPEKTAAIIIDMQRDFMEPGGFGEALGNDVSQLRTTIAPLGRLLAGLRQRGVFIIHTREGHRPDMSDAHRAKVERGAPKVRIGDPGPMGRILIRGEPGHDIIPELYPLPSEPVIDKPGKGAFYATDLGTILQSRGVTTLIVCGVTTEVCVHTTIREANDRGFVCLVPSDCTASYFPEFKEVALRMVSAQGGIFGWVSDSERILGALEV